MHDLINRSIECFLRDTYGEDFWTQCTRSVGLTTEGGEALFGAKETMTRNLIAHAGRSLQKPVDSLMEDMGTYMVSHANSQRLRRLLRFSGETFEDFLHSLDDLPDRARMAVGDLHLPVVELVEVGAGRYRLDIGGGMEGFAAVMLGALRAVADDYGALVLLEPDEPDDADAGETAAGETQSIQISLLDRAFAEGKDFSLASIMGESDQPMGDHQ